MYNLKIQAEGLNIILPRCYYSIGSRKVVKEVEMASGKLVQDIIGSRTILNCEFEYIPAVDLANLVKIIRSCHYLDVEYQDVDGSIKTEKFKVSEPQPEIFKFVDGIAIWVNVSLRMEGQEVS